MLKTRFKAPQLVIAVLAMVLPAPSAKADIVASTDRPNFTAAEEEVIDRNASLRKIVTEDPWAVRQVLDALKRLEVDAAPPASTSPGPETQDPDLNQLERASPEAAHDLLQIIKEVGTETKK